MKKSSLIYLPGIIIIAIMLIVVFRYYSGDASTDTTTVFNIQNVTNPQLPEFLNTAEKQIFPVHGTVKMNSDLECISWFEVNTPDKNLYYYIMLIRESDGETIVVYLNPNQVFRFDIPLGVYQIYYAYGENWYGDDELFGINSACYKFDETLNFYEYEEDNTRKFRAWTVILEVNPDEAVNGIERSSISRSELINKVTEGATE